jgi:hypothetical protein
MGKADEGHVEPVGRGASCGWGGAVEQSDEADEAFAGTVTRQKCRLMPAPSHF